MALDRLADTAISVPLDHSGRVRVKVVMPVATSLRSTHDSEAGSHCLIARIGNAGVATGKGDRAEHIWLDLGAVDIAPDGVEYLAHVTVAVDSIDQGDANARGIGICLGLALGLHEGGIQRIRHVSTVAVAWRVADSDVGAAKE